MIAAIPSSPSGSASSGMSRQICTATTCCPGRWQRSTVSPLARAPRSGTGNAQGFACPGAGWGWKSMVTAASVTARLRPACRSRRPALACSLGRAGASSAVTGSYTSTARLSGRSRAAATARTSSAVTSRIRLTAVNASCGSPNSTAYRHSSSARPATVPSRSSHSRSSMGLRPLHLPGGRRLRAEPRQFLVDGGLDLRDLARRRRLSRPASPARGRQRAAPARRRPSRRCGRGAPAGCRAGTTCRRRGR